MDAVLTVTLAALVCGVVALVVLLPLRGRGCPRCGGRRSVDVTGCWDGLTEYTCARCGFTRYES